MNLLLFFKLWKNRRKSFENYVRFQMYRAILLHKDIASFMKKSKNKKIFAPSKLKLLDIGSHRGGYSIQFSKLGYNVTGLEISKDRIKTATEMNKKLQGRARFIHGNAEKLPFKSNTFDIIIASNVIEHLQNPSLLLKESHRVLKNNSLLYLQFPPYYGPIGAHIYYKFLPLPLNYLPKTISKKIIKALNCDTEFINPITISKVIKTSRSIGFKISSISSPLIPNLILKIPKLRELVPFCNIIMEKRIGVIERIERIEKS